VKKRKPETSGRFAGNGVYDGISGGQIRLFLRCSRSKKKERSEKNGEGLEHGNFVSCQENKRGENLRVQSFQNGKALDVAKYSRGKLCRQTSFI